MNRVRADTVTFARPFLLQKINRELPAGSYPVETDEEILKGPATTVYRRTEIRLFVPRIEGKSDAEMWSISPHDFDKAIARDREPSVVQPLAARPDAPSLAQRTAAFEKDRDDTVNKRSERRSGPFFGACAGIVALLFATWIAHQVEPDGAQPAAAAASSSSN